jgi:hypothetical protein
MQRYRTLPLRHEGREAASRLSERRRRTATERANDRRAGRDAWQSEESPTIEAATWF